MRTRLHMLAVGFALITAVCFASASGFGQAVDSVHTADTLHLVDTLQPPDSQEARSEQPIVIVKLGDWTFHPDGILGKPSFHTQLTYASVTGGDQRRPVGDIQRFTFGLDLVAASRLTLLSSVRIIVQDSTRYEVSGGARVYAADPLSDGRKKNPDGPIGGFSLSGLIGARVTSAGNSTSHVLADANVAIPVSTHLTLGGGYRYYEKLELLDVQRGYGSISYYPASYSKDSAYVNPDGPVGSLALKLSGGGSSNGIFGDFQVLLPFSGDMTIALLIRGERVPGPPYRRSAIGGFNISYYP